MSSVTNLLPTAAIGVANGAGGFTATDMSDRIRAITTDRGRTVGSLALPNAGTASITLGNEDGGLLFDSNDVAGAIRPGSTIVIGGSYQGGQSFDVFTGKVDRIDVRRNLANTDETAVLTCSDAFRDLAQEPALFSLSVGQGDTPGQRLDRILDRTSLNPPAAQRDIGFGTFANLYDATTFGATPLQELTKAVQADAALFWLNASGVFTYRERGYRPPPSSTSPLIIGDTSAYIRRLGDLTVSFSAEHVINRVSIQGANGSIGQQDPGSVARLGLRPFRISGSLQSGPTQMNATAAAILSVATRAVSVTPLTFNAGRGGSMSTLLALLELYDEIRVDRTLTGQTVSELARIERIRHTWVAMSPWSTTLEVRTMPPIP